MLVSPGTAAFGSLALILALSLEPALAATDAATAALIQRQSQAFSDASASGDAAVLAELLDDRVAFMDEDGVVSTKRELLAGTHPSPKGTSVALVQSDFRVRLHGPVAVTSFTDTSTAKVFGRPVVAKFRSTEVWYDEPAGWRMISSQTLAVPSAPPAVRLPISTLDEYVGTYSAGSGYDVAIERRGEALVLSAPNRPRVTLHAELRDVFFADGQLRVRRIFRRSDAGKVIGFTSRREGHDLVLERVS